MKIWERRLMKDFQVAPIEVAENEPEPEPGTVKAPVETPLDRFKRISKQVASGTTSAKWNDIIRSATIEANSQIGRCRNRDSFRNQQNLLKAMDQARKLIERSPLPPSPNHSEYSVVDQTNETLVQLLKNISEEINEFSPKNTLCVNTPKERRSVTPLHSLNVQLQSLINSKNSSPCKAKERPKTRPTSPKPTILHLSSKSMPNDSGLMSPPIKTDIQRSPSLPKSPKSPSKFEHSKAPLSTPPASILKNNNSSTRSPTSDSSSNSMDDTKSIESVEAKMRPQKIFSTSSVEITCEDETQKSSSPEAKLDSPKLLINLNDEEESTPPKVIKRKAPAPVPIVDQDISISRPIAPKVPQNQGMIPPPPTAKKEEIKPLQIPILSTTPATPLPCQKLFFESSSPLASPTSQTPEPAKVITSETPAVIAVVPVASLCSSTEKLVSSSNPNTEANFAASSPPSSLRPVNKIEDVKTIKRQMKTGWL